MSETQNEKVMAPFVPWNTFKAFIYADLKAKVVPPKIDSSMFTGKSGTDARLLRSTLRFHGLVKGDNDETTDRLRALVSAYGTDDWKASVNELLRSYEPILKGVNITEGTQKELDDAFRNRGDVTGSTLKKAVRLYLAMAKEAGVKLSPHFTPLRGVGEPAESSPSQPSVAVPNGAPKVAKKRKSKPATSADGGGQVAPVGVVEIRPLPGREFRAWIPSDISDAELAFSMKVLNDYLKLTRAKGAKGGKEG